MKRILAVLACFAPVAAYAGGATFPPGLMPGKNLSDLPSATTARTNLGLGTLATQSAASAAITGGTITGADVSGANVTAIGGTVARTAAARAADILDIRDFGAKCDGTSDDGAAINLAVSAGKPFTVPAGTTCNAPSVSFTAIAGMSLGPGQIKTSDGNLRGPLLTEVTARPATGTWGSDGAAWNGALGGTRAHEHIVTGSTTLGQPTSTYLQIPEASGEILGVYNTSGWNNSLSGNTGRTGLAGKYFKLFQYGQGDLTAQSCYGVVGSTLAGATSYLASPAIECLSGELFGGADGQYIELLGDLDIADNGHDIAGVGTVLNFSRTNAAEGIGANWVGDIRQSSGTQPIDAFYRATGPATMGLDLTNATFSSYRLASLTLNGGGSGYTVGDILTVSGGTAATPTVLQVASLGTNGAIATINVVNTGIYSAPPISVGAYLSLPLTGGSGTGVSASGYYDNNVALLLPSTGGCIKPAGNVGSSITEISGYYSAFCITQAGMTFGQSNSVPTAPGANNVVLGPSNTLLGKNNTVLGSAGYDEAGVGLRLFSNGGLNGTRGAAQTTDRLLKGSGTSTLDLTTDQGGATTQNTFFAPTGSANGVSVRVIATDVTTPGNYARWNLINGMLTRTSSGNAAYTGADTTATAPDISLGAGATSSITISADTTVQRMKVLWTPPSGNTDTWHVVAVVVGDQVE